MHSVSATGAITYAIFIFFPGILMSTGGSKLRWCSWNVYLPSSYSISHFCIDLDPMGAIIVCCSPRHRPQVLMFLNCRLHQVSSFRGAVPSMQNLNCSLENQLPTIFCNCSSTKQPHSPTKSRKLILFVHTMFVISFITMNIKLKSKFAEWTCAYYIYYETRDDIRQLTLDCRITLWKLTLWWTGIPHSGRHTTSARNCRTR